MLVSEAQSMLDKVYGNSDVITDVELSINADKTLTILILYPSVTVSNDINEEIELTNLLFKANFRVEYSAEYDDFVISRITGIYGYNLNPTENMLITGYAHSHISSLSNSNVCLGGDTELSNVFDRMRLSSSIDQDDFISFFFMLDTLAHYESLNGRPYRYIKHALAGDLPENRESRLDSDIIDSFYSDYGSPEEDISEYQDCYYHLKEERFISELKDLLDAYYQDPNCVNKYIKKSLEKLHDMFKVFLVQFGYHDDLNSNEIRMYSHMVLCEDDMYDNLREYHDEIVSLMQCFGSGEIDSLAYAMTEHGKYLLSEESEFKLLTGNQKGYYALYNYDQDEYTDTLYDMYDVESYLSDYVDAPMSNIDDYTYSVKNIVFLIKGKIYRGQPESITKEIENNFNVYENTRKEIVFKDAWCICRIINQVVKPKTHRNKAITSDAICFLKSTSSVPGSLSV